MTNPFSDLSKTAKYLSSFLAFVISLSAVSVLADGWFVSEAEAAAKYATKQEVSALRQQLPLEIEKLRVSGQIEELGTIIQYGLQHGIDTELDKLKRQNLLHKLDMLNNKMDAQQ